MGIRQVSNAPSGDMITGSDGSFEGHVLLIGFGRVGEIIAIILRGSSVPYVSLSTDPNQIRIGRGREHPVYYGDASLPSVLEAAKIREARLVIIALDDPKASLNAVRAVRNHYPTISISARAYDFLHAAELENAGATLAISETAEVSIQLGREGLFQLGMSDDLTDETVKSYRQGPYGLVRMALEGEKERK